LRLKTRPFQQHRLQTAFKVGRNSYHSCLGELYRRFDAMSGDGFFQEILSLPKDHPNRGALLNERHRQYLVSEYDLHA
jgi:hypothetical protein